MWLQVLQFPDSGHGGYTAKMIRFPLLLVRGQRLMREAVVLVDGSKRCLLVILGPLLIG
jgi:hypothetical protein